jgi:predicted phage tail protein
MSSEKRPVAAIQQALSNRPSEVPESVWSALVRVYDIGQRMVVERIELAKLEIIGFARVELAASARQLVRNVVLGVAGGILLVAGWFILTWGLVNLTASGLTMAWRLLIEAGLNLVLGGALLWLASRSKPQPTEKLDP